MINAPDWDDLDLRIARIQAHLGNPGENTKADVTEALTDIRGDLATLRYYESPVTVTNVPAEAPPLVVAAEAPAPAVLIPEAQTTAMHRASGFTGNICDQCGGVHMIPSGTCELCNDCGSTTGCS